MTGKDILQEEFEKAGMRGYKADQVDDFLRKIATFVDEQEVDKNDLTYKIKILADKIEEYKADEENIRDALLGAQKLGTSILNEAKTKSEAMLREAKSTYDDTMSQARSKAESMTKESLQKANLDLNEVKRDCERERVVLERMKKEVSAFKASILKQYKSHLDMLSSIPSMQAASSFAPATEASTEEAIAPQTPAPEAPRAEFFDEIKPAVEETRVKSSFFDQDTPTFSRAQTVTSDLLTNTRELLNEEKEQTKEFVGDATLTKVHEEEETAEQIPEEGKQEEFKVNFGTQPHQRPNYMEKFGELKFGGFGQSENK